MIRFKIPHLYIGPLVACLCLGLSATSCVDDEAGCIEDRPGYVDGNDIWLSFTVKGEEAAGGGREIPRPGAGASSRAADAAGHPEEAATAAEDFIRTGDLRLLLFDNRRNLLKILDSDEIISFGHVDGSGTSVYEVKARINRAYFDYAGTAENFDMSLMLVANLDGYGGGHDFPGAGSYFMKATGWISHQLHSFGYTATVGATDGEAWYPDGSARAIPMAGLKHYTVNRARLDAATEPDEAYQPDGSGETADNVLVLQRAVAKIRVFDNINKANAEADTEITKVEITGLNSRGAFMPDFSTAGDLRSAWAEGTAMVEKATVDPAWLTGLSAPTRKVGPADGGEYVFDDPDNPGAAPLTFTEAFVAYIPEADLTSASAQSPKLVITTKSPLDMTADNPEGVREWTPLDLSTIISGSLDITRNHIYEFAVTRSIDSQLSVNYTVCPWLSAAVTIPPFD